MGWLKAVTPRFSPQHHRQPLGVWAVDEHGQQLAAQEHGGARVGEVPEGGRVKEMSCRKTSNDYTQHEDEAYGVSNG